MRSAPRIFMLLGAMSLLAGCGTSASPASSAQASAAAEQASQGAAVAVFCEPAPRPFDPNDIDLNGAWAGEDGGIFYLRHLLASDVLWWIGMSDRDGSPLDLGRRETNVARGEINGLQIDLEWADVPRGEEDNYGTVRLVIQDDGTGNIQILALGQPGGWADYTWTPCAPVEREVADYVRNYGGAASQYGLILTLEACEDLADLESSVRNTMDTEEAGSPEWRAALGYSTAINERQLDLDC